MLSVRQMRFSRPVYYPRPHLRPEPQNNFCESSRMVTGPSFTNSTCICSWNRPVSQRRPAARILATKCSYSSRASSGRAAASNDGRFPRRTSPDSVNCETASTAPPLSATERFILPSSSSKIRSPAIFSARYSASAAVSAWATPSKTSSPGPISPTSSPCTVTRARVTRCMTARMTRNLQFRLRPVEWAEFTPGCFTQFSSTRYTNRFNARRGSNMASVDEKVKQIIVEQLGVEESDVTQSASFVDDLGADSLDTVELVMAFEEAFDIEIPDEDAEKIRTVQDAIDYIGKHAKAAK